MKKLLLLLVMILLPMVASADDSGTCGENLTWNYEESTKTLTISGTGAMTDYTPELSPWYENRTKILKLVLNDGITSVGNYAFANCSITSVSIPNSVTSIGKMAFYRTGLTSITIPNSVISVDEHAFSSCEHLVSITIPNSVKSIGDYAFADCSITSITIPNSVTSIGKGAFERCKRLTSVSIPNSVTEISEVAFASCSSLTSITIPNSVTSISKMAFYECSGLTSITIPNSVTSIGDFAFVGCTGLTAVNITDLEAWLKIDFVDRHSNPLLYANSLILNGTEIKDLVIPNGMTSIGFTFSGWTGLTSITIPNSVTAISGMAFYKCSGLTSISIPNSVTSIGVGAFDGCTGLTAVNITDLEAWCKTDFVDKYSNPLLYAKSLVLNGIEIKDLVIPNSVTSIGQLAFYGYKSLTSVTIPNSVTSIGGGAFSGCSGLTSATISNSVISIGESAFERCSSLTSVTIPNSVTSIGERAFAGCSNLTSVTIPNSVTAISEEAFSHTGLINITIPESVVDIQSDAFSYCRSVKTITLGSKVNNIGSSCFRYCISLTEVYCYAATPPNVDIYSFTETPVKNVVLYVPKSATSSYRLHSRWNQFKAINKIPMPEYTITYLLDGKVYKTYNYEEGETITPEASVMRVGYTFSGWSEIPKTMPAKDVTVIGTLCVNKYKLIYKVDGAGYKTYEVEYGASITAEAAPTKEGYTFSGWSEISETMPAKDVTVTGTFSINKYKLIYKVDGADYKTYDIEYGADITADAAPIKEGYSFSGWNDIPSTMPANDVTVTGTFVANKYKLIYQVDGADYKSYEVEYGATITPEAAPTKVGHIFSGWGTIPATMPAHDVYVNGTFSKGNYKLTYKVDGVDYKTISYDYGTLIIPETTPIKEGYTFSGWSEIPTTMPANDVTVTGTFAINKYKLVYQVDGEDYKIYDVEYGATITPEANPTKVGHTFSGWGTILAMMPAHDVYVNGTFSKNNYKLIYNIDGVDYKTISYDYGTLITPETTPIKEGYTFSGWSEIPTTMPSNDVTVTGTFTANKYILIYQVDGEDYKSYDVECGATITPEANPTKEGHIFSGWGNIPETMPPHDVYINGTFSKGSYKLTYKVDGVDYKTISYDYGATITPEAAPIKEGYTFNGWSEIPATMPANDVAITGTFAVNKYKLVYQVDGEDYKIYDVEYGATITPEAAPTKEGYTFSGWSEIPAIMPASDVAVTGTFAVNKYKLVYQVDGANYKSYEVEYSATITPEAAPTREGYTFSGWSEIPATMPAKGITITGTFSVNKYKFVYMVDGAEYKTYEVEYGASITPEAAPTKEGYTFSGWGEIPSIMPANDITISGTFSVNKTYKVNLSKTTAVIENGKTLTLKATLTPSDLSDKSVTWKSSNTKVATVSSDGVVKGVKAGTATITCTSIATGAKATCKVTVGYVKLDKTEATLEKGKTLTLKATFTPSDFSDKSMTWKSSNTKVATVSSAGKVEGVKAGTATITCTSKATGLKATCTVTVGYVKLDKTEATLEKGKTLTLKATVYPSSLTDKSVTWKSSNTKIATVTSAGKVKAVKAGTATITCTSKATGLKETCTVTVVNGTVTLNKKEAYVEKGKTVTLKATLTPTTLTDKSVTWKSSDTKIATVSSSGKVKGVKYGTVTITCTSKATGASATCQVTVGKVVVSITEVSIKKTRTITLEATVYPTTLTDKSVTWTSSNTKVATVSSSGKVKGVKTGTATITCTSVATGLKGTCTVTVLAVAESRSSFGDDDDTTDIEDLDERPAVEEPYDVYDLSGRKVRHQVTSLDGLPNGIYIVNGKKIFKK